MKSRDHTVRIRMRRVSAVALLVAVNLVILSPIRHQDHHSLTPAVAEDGDRDPDIHLCSTGEHANPEINCPICLSQRLLTQSDTEATTELTAPASVTVPRITRSLPAGIDVSHDSRARAPPTV